MSQLIGKRSGLLPFLRKAKLGLTTPSPTGAQIPRTDVLVTGNTSADLDSIVSAIIYSYFSTRPERTYVPIINLPDVSTGSDLRRLRLEFIEALKLSLDSTDNDLETAALDNYLTTTANLRDVIRERIAKASPENRKQHLDLMLVDWNYLPQTHGTSHGLSGLSDVFKDDLEISIVGCIDHHVDESFVPPLENLPGHDPRCVQVPVGSCTSLVVRELRARNLWPQNRDEDPETILFQAQAAKLALSAILVDTTNMANENTMTEVDRVAVEFLQNEIDTCISRGGSVHWERDAFYETICNVKRTSLDRLTMQEILGRDYKEWTETLGDNTDIAVRIGICSIVKPTAWLLKVSNFKSNDHPSFFDELHAFAANRGLDAVAVMTSFSDSNQQHSRELILHVLNENCAKEAQFFESHCKDVLGLENWAKKASNDKTESLPTDSDEMEVFVSKNSVGSQKLHFQKIWQQNNTAKSRKQVAPLMRDLFSKRISYP